MFQLQCFPTLLAVVVILLQMTVTCIATPIESEVAHAPFNCVYEVQQATDVEPVDAYNPQGRKTLEECLAICEKQPHCNAIRHNHDNGLSNCDTFAQKGYGVIPTKPKKGVTILQIVADSCNKPVATPTPVACKPGIFTAPTGCKYKVTCNTGMARFDEPGFVINDVSERECAQMGETDHKAYAYTYYQGGNCIGGNADHFIMAETQHFANATTAQPK